MTIPASNDDAASVLVEVASSPSPVSAVEALWEYQSPAAPRSRVARLLGRSPLVASARDRYAAALGEARTAELLRTLSTSGEAWRVLHAIPVLDGAPPVDHLVVGPSGVFAVTCATPDESVPGAPGASGAPVALARDHAVPGAAAHGARTAPARDHTAEARRASEVLSAAVGRAIVVRPIVVAVVPGRPRPAGEGVDVVALDRLVRHLRSLVPVQSVDEVREVTRVALRPRTWRPRGTPSFPHVSGPTGAGAGVHAHPTASELGFWFARLRIEVARARRVRAVWVTALGAAAAWGSFDVVAPTIVQQLSA